MIGAEKGLLWFMSRNITPNMCLNPLTWFTDTANHNFINTITSFIIIIFSSIYILYCVYLNSITYPKNLIKIIFFQLCIRYALYLPSLKNNIHAFTLSKHLDRYTKNEGKQVAVAEFTMQKELKNAIDNMTETVELLKITVQRKI